MAAGDILAVEVGADGWWADITIEGVGTGGTYALTPDGTPKLALIVTSLGFDDAGAATTVTRTVYGTKQVRKPHPNAAQNEETVVGTDVRVRVALSDYVYAKDKAGVGNSGTDITATVLAGLYTQGGTPSNARASFTATNSSTATHQKVIGNWSWPGRDKVDATITPRFVAFHRHGQQGRPVRAVRFTATGDTSGATASQTVTAMTVDSGMGDAAPVPEFIGDIPTTVFTQGETITLRAEVFPWVGDTGSLLDTSTGAASPSPLVGPRRVVCDKAGTYSTGYAVVDPVSGNDATGAVQTGTVTATAPYLTIHAAVNALRAYNSTTYGRANKGGSTIYLRAGAHPWLGVGSNPTADSIAPEAWLTVTRFPGDARANVRIASINSTTNGHKFAGLLLKVADVTIDAQAATGIFFTTAGGMVWFDQCDINIPQPGSGSNVLITVASGAAGVWNVTRSTVTALDQGFRPVSTSNMPCALIRGNTITVSGRTGSGQNLVYTMIGNVKASTNGNFVAATHIASMTAPVTANAVVAYNRLTVGVVSSPILQARMTEVDSHGMAIVQNLMENTAAVSSPLLQFAADGATNTPVDNVLIWHNVMVGQRLNMAYNDTGAAAYLRHYWSVKNNIADDNNIKADTFVHPTDGASGARVGNWPQLFGAGNSGNLFAETVGIGAAGEFQHEYAGRSSVQPAGTSTLAYIGFVNRQSYDGTSAGAGGGDYHLDNGSPAEGLAVDWLLSHDLDGNPRTAADDAGVYAAVAAALGLTVAGGALTTVGGTLTAVG